MANLENLVYSTSTLPVSPLASYQRMTPIDHILQRPGMYIGSMDITENQVWLLNESKTRMALESMRYSSALLKILDEILVNAADNRHRDKLMSHIHVKIKKKNNKLVISVKNNGKGIPIDLHPTEKIHIPELIFGHLLTGSNFNDNENLMTGGRHGYGAKLTNIFSKSFHVEIYDSKNHQLYTQSWSNNMQTMSAANIQTVKKSNNNESDYTKVEFEPDLLKFGYANGDNSTSVDNCLLEDYVRLVTRRVYDIAATVSPQVRVSLNDKIVPIKSFLDYVNLFRSDDSTDGIVDRTANDTVSADDIPAQLSDARGDTVRDDPVFYFKLNDHWSIAVKRSTTGDFENMSFVNSVWTPRGGSHVNHVLSKILTAFQTELKKKKSPMISSSSIKNKLMVFLRCEIENPSFDSQSKESLTKKISDISNVCDIPPKYMKRIVHGLGVIEDIQLSSQSQDKSNLEKIIARKKSNKQILDVPKLEDAHDAQTSHALDCTLILTEGDSAKALAIAGIEVVGRKRYGVLPLRGKILNVRDMSLDKVGQSQELVHIVKVLGLSFTKDYANGLEGQGLRYGHVMIMCDQDHDGSHIKGLIINFFHHFWPNLLKHEDNALRITMIIHEPEVLNESDMITAVYEIKFITPLVKVKKSLSDGNKSKSNNSIISFYSIPEFEEWLDLNKGKNYKVKYYKGLGTNTAVEGQDYFKALNIHRKTFQSYNESIDSELIDLAFRKERANDRREWLTTKYDPQVFINPKDSKISYSDFINKELIQFSYADNYRSMPSVIDGLKPSQRKVLYSCFKRKLTEEIKVVQLAGYVAEQTAYHHGEASLHATIIHMAQDFVGSNNVPLLEPSGQFGTRAQGGQDYASPRYIFTRLSSIARYLYPASDDSLLEYNVEDGQRVEPKFYIPIIPTLLLNGSEGIGTGWSTSIPKYNIMDIIEHVEALISGRKPERDLIPWYKDYKGIIKRNEDLNRNEFHSYGVIKKTTDGAYEIKELPIGVWTSTYKEYLYKLVEKGILRRIVEAHTTATADFKIFFHSNQLEDNDEDSKMKLLKLQNTISLSNMHAFDANQRIKSYSTVDSILGECFDIRLITYTKRKQSIVQQLSYNELLSRQKAQFIEDILSNRINILSTKDNSNQIKSYNTENVINQLRNRGYIPLSPHEDDLGYSASSTAAAGAGSGISDSATNSSSPIDGAKSFSYLLDMPIISLTQEKSILLKQNAQRSKKALLDIQSQEESTMWLTDLKKLKDKVVDMQLV